MTTSVESWWRKGVFYQIYPRSFQDLNGDGVGDLKGIVHRLPYLRALGVDAIWLSPIFPSPMADFGYDIADYIGIDPLFGTMQDFDALIEAVHASGLKIILDLVPNHTSDRHPWFIESRSSRDNPRRDWYIWHEPGADGGPPNNWLSEFGGSAWEYDAATRQYYYHAFLAQQPDLNWRNPAVRQAVHDVMRFWLRKGVDGFRVDVIWHLVKDAEFRDNPPNPEYREGQPPHQMVLPLHTTDQAEVHGVIAQMRQVIDEFNDRVLIGEIYLPLERLVTYYGRDDHAEAPSAIQLCAAVGALERTRDREDHRRLRNRTACGGLAELGAGQSRPPAGRRQGRSGTGAGRRDAVADTARDADAVLRRRNRHASGRDCAGSGARSVREERAGNRRRPGWLPDADAVERRA